MSNLAIRVENLSKQYRIGRARYRHDSIRDHLAEWAKSLFVRNGHGSAHSAERVALRAVQRFPDDTFWALKDVSFEVKQGEVIGIIGRNGAGKSTLLKILSRIVEPTSGFAEIHGRVGSLLEVGTGFQRDLTGRENVYLNGAILGMKKAEIERKFDEIVAFSEIEKFIDTPVKRYSSGMYVRLAFAVAAHMLPEILIVDEVLAVGDVAFQKKCLGKMENVANEGRTVLFVSHNMSTIKNLCQLGVVLNGGRLSFFGSTNGAIDLYLSGGARSESGFVDLTEHHDRPPGSPSIIRSLGLLANGGESRYRATVMPGEDLVFEIQYDTGGLSLDYAVLGITSSLRERVCTVGTHLSPGFSEVFLGKGILECRVPKVALVEGEYSVMVAMGRRLQARNVEYIDDALRFRVGATDYFGTGASLIPGQGYFAVRSQWRVVPDADNINAPTLPATR